MVGCLLGCRWRISFGTRCFAGIGSAHARLRPPRRLVYLWHTGPGFVFCEVSSPCGLASCAPQRRAHDLNRAPPAAPARYLSVFTAAYRSNVRARATSCCTTGLG
jgi:hypothetical protein